MGLTYFLIIHQHEITTSSRIQKGRAFGFDYVVLGGGYYQLTWSPIFKPLSSAQPAFTSKTYCAGTRLVTVFG